MSLASEVQRRAQLIIDGPSGSRTITLTAGSSFLGNGEDDQIQLADDIVNPKHIEFDWDESELWLIYLGKGTRPSVNGQLVAEAKLSSGDQIELGEHTLTVRILRRTVTTGDTAVTSASPRTSRPETAGSQTDADESLGEADAQPEAPTVNPDDQVLLEFSVHMLREQPRKGLIVSIGLIAFFLVMRFYIIPDSTFLLGFAVLVMVGSVGAFLFPLRYRITENGVEIRGFPIRDRKRWGRFASYAEFPDAVQLFVSQKDLRGRIIKGSLIYYGQHKDEVLTIVKSKIAKGGLAPADPGRRLPKWLPFGKRKSEAKS